MNSTQRILLVALVVGMATSCAHVPRMTNQDPERNSIRDEYLRDNPNGAFNQHIVRGEVVKGMSIIDVLAAWGMPEKRMWDGPTNKESWVYASRDEYSHDYLVYELIFENRKLSHWSINRGTVASGGVIPAGVDGRTDGDRLSQPPGGGLGANVVSPKK